MLVQSFEGLVNRVGPPPAALPAPTSSLPAIDMELPSIKGAEVSVPTWQEIGFTEAPTSIFKVRGIFERLDLFQSVSQLLNVAGNLCESDTANALANCMASRKILTSTFNQSWDS